MGGCLSVKSRVLLCGEGGGESGILCRIFLNGKELRHVQLGWWGFLKSYAR